MNSAQELAHELARILFGEGPARVRVSTPRGKVLLVCGSEPARPEASVEAGPGWLALSPLSEAVVNALGEGWLTAQEIAERIRERPSGRLRVVLADMVERHILESDMRRGYRVKGEAVEEPRP